MRAVIRGLALALLCGTAQAEALRACNPGPPPSLRQQDRLLQLSQLIQQDLEARGARLAVVARAGTDLRRFGVDYSHAGLALRHNPQGPWAVRQLYYDCEARQSALFDQGLTGFLLGSEGADQGRLLVLLLPAEAEGLLEQAALDRERALALMGPQYVANAHPDDALRQNCNQWLAELLAEAWGAAGRPEPTPRERAQAWLRDQGHAVQPVQLSTGLWFVAAAFVPWLSQQGHPPEDRAALQLRTTLPRDLHALLQRQHPQLQRVEWCHVQSRAIRRENGAPLGEGCLTQAGDRVMALDAATPGD
ncbi:hypothetical protein HNQ51_001356 [Inhella inkyongensis]|uniref:DUF2145 domain-containing protein n=1 Tax=Inhella inkyongensis TaxID=392593 RepID=A0A840S2U7_9BURK|nr:DUF2145 domain-containing protein [Inhella inkyongensis]MBB5204063.1 hypothetical protein [Inhella inkyongensis]